MLLLVGADQRKSVARHVRIANRWQGTYELQIGGQARSLQEFMGSSILLPNFISSFQINAFLITYFCIYLSVIYIPYFTKYDH